jgi:hypothetical protein
MTIRQAVGQHYARSPDGARMLVNRPVEQPAIAPATLVQNWTMGLGR